MTSRKFSLALLAIFVAAIPMVAADDGLSTKQDAPQAYVPLSKVELRRKLSRLQFDVTQNEATEPAFRNRYWDNKQTGIYHCIVCDQQLFSSATKFKSGTGWPSFFAPLDEKNVGFRNDRKMFFLRIEVHCKRCGAHLGHVFGDGPPPTGKRFCMNSASLKFVDQSESEDQESPKTGKTTAQPE